MIEGFWLFKCSKGNGWCYQKSYLMDAAAVIAFCIAVITSSCQAPSQRFVLHMALCANTVFCTGRHHILIPYFASLLSKQRFLDKKGPYFGPAMPKGNCKSNVTFFIFHSFKNSYSVGQLKLSPMSFELHNSENKPLEGKYFRISFSKQSWRATVFPRWLYSIIMHQIYGSGWSLKSCILLITVSYNYSLAQCMSCSDLDYVLSLITNIDQITSTRSAKQHVFLLYLLFWSCGCQNL